MTTIEAILGDITSLHVDAIVNAANSSLLGGGGVDGAIHNAAGPDLVHECRLLGGCKPGQAKITKGYNLPAKFIIHTVGPVWNGGNKDEPQILESCYRNSLEIAKENSIKSIAFPCISTGIFGYPADKATKAAISTVEKFVTEFPEQMTSIQFCCFSKDDFTRYQTNLADRKQ